jgi:phage gpG-like protein
VGTNVRYAAIHEHGGTINHPGGTAYYFDERRGRAVFLSNHKAGGHNFPRTRPHPIPIQARPFLRPALDQKRFEALSIIRKVYAGPLAIGEA